MQRLIKDLMLKNSGVTSNTAIFDVPLKALDDSGVADGIVFTTDSYTVKPIFFPGGDIGRLAVAGTINDIAVIGGDPIALSSAFIIEEGFAIDDLEKILQSMHSTCVDAGGVNIVTGDTKVVERGALDRVIINTSAIGRRSDLLDGNMMTAKKFRSDFDANWLLDSNIRTGDKIIVSGTIGDHSIAVMSARGSYGFETNVESDVAPLNKMIRTALEVGGVVSIKDPTRGGLSNVLNEWSEKSHHGILIQEDKIPVKDNVKSVLGFLGLDVLDLGNEGKVCLATVPQKADEVLQALKGTKEGIDAMIIGEATDQFDIVVLETLVGGKRILPQPVGDPVPRIC